MPVYNSSITSEQFNHSYKDCLKDLYIYQVKKKSSITAESTRFNDKARLRALMSEELGVQWTGAKKSGVKMDSRWLDHNPFFDLYRTCSYRTGGNLEERAGLNFAILFALELVFHSPDEVTYDKCYPPLSEKEEEILLHNIETFLTPDERRQILSSGDSIEKINQYLCYHLSLYKECDGWGKEVRWENSVQNNLQISPKIILAETKQTEELRYYLYGLIDQRTATDSMRTLKQRKTVLKQILSEFKDSGNDSKLPLAEKQYPILYRGLLKHGQDFIVEQDKSKQCGYRIVLKSTKEAEKALAKDILSHYGIKRDISAKNEKDIIKELQHYLFNLINMFVPSCPSDTLEQKREILEQRKNLFKRVLSEFRNAENADNSDNIIRRYAEIYNTILPKVKNLCVEQDDSSLQGFRINIVSKPTQDIEEVLTENEKDKKEELQSYLFSLINRNIPSSPSDTLKQKQKILEQRKKLLKQILSEFSYSEKTDSHYDIKKAYAEIYKTLLLRGQDLCLKPDDSSSKGFRISIVLQSGEAIEKALIQYVQSHFKPKLLYSQKEVEQSVKEAKEQAEKEAHTANLYLKLLCSRKHLEIEKNGSVSIQPNEKWFEARALYSLLCSLFNVALDVEQFISVLNGWCRLGILRRQNGHYYWNDQKLPKMGKNDFSYRFQEMVRFFSETEVLGEVGHFILARMDPYESKIAYKHNSLQRALNDYNLIDILYAMKKEMWLKIEYVSDTNKEETAKEKATDEKNEADENEDGEKKKTNKKKIRANNTIYAYPMAIRENSADGRQFVLCYLPDKHTLRSIRLDRIDNITIGKLKSNPSYFEEEKKNAQNRLDHTWGVSCPEQDGGNVKHPLKKNELQTIDFSVSYNPDKEPYIRERFVREVKQDISRQIVERSEPPKNEMPQNSIHFHAEVTDVHEVIKWVRTFSTRITSLKVNGEEYKEYQNDIEDLTATYKQDSPKEMFQNTTERSYGTKNTACDSVEFIDTKFKPHTLLFHFFFSDRLRLMGEILYNKILSKKGTVPKDIEGKLCAEFARIYSEDEYRLLFDEQKKHPSKMEIDKRESLLKAMQIKTLISSFVNMSDVTSEGYPTFVQLKKDRATKNAYDWFPLTDIEVQWLNNILSHEKALMFLTKEERDAMLKQYPDPGLFDIRDVKYFNRYRTEQLRISDDQNKVLFYSKDGFYKEFYRDEACGDMLRCILRAIRNSTKLNIQYFDKNGNKYHQGMYIPIKLEYSKRDDVFRLYAICDSDGKLYPMNLERMLSCKSASDKTFDAEKAQKDFFAFLQSNRRSVIVCFQEKKNIPDRILMEFASWEKECKYSPGKKMYTLTIWYDKYDAAEIIIRLLSYGRSVFVKKDGGYNKLEKCGKVKEPLIQRINNQHELIKERGKERE